MNRNPFTSSARSVLVAFMLTVGALFTSMSHVNAGTTPNSNTKSTQTVTIQRTEHVHDILAIAQRVIVMGDVTDNLVAIDSNVDIQTNAHVDTLLVIGGTVHRAQGSTIRNALIFAPRDGVLGHAALGIAFMSFGMILKFIASLVIVFSSVAFSVLLKPWMYRALRHFDQSIRRSFLMGLLISVGAFAAMLGLAVTGIGLPVAVFVGLIDIVIGVIGLSNLSVFIGQWILKRYEADIPTWRSALVGSLFVVGGINFPVVGVLLFAVVWCIGTSSTIALLNLNRTKR